MMQLLRKNINVFLAMQILLLLPLVAVQSYPSNPHGSNPYKSQNEVKKDYSFAYGVKDNEAGLEFNQDEKSEQGHVMGNYAVQLPDGRKQIVNYQADHEIGYLADVIYQGTASYPPGADHDPISLYSDINVPIKGSYIPPKRYPATKDTPKKDSNIPKKVSYIPKKEIYRPPLLDLPKKEIYRPPQLDLPKKEIYRPPQLDLPKKEIYSPPQLDLPKKEIYRPPQLDLPKKQIHRLPQLDLPKKEIYRPPQLDLPKKEIYRPPQLVPNSNKPVKVPNRIRANKPHLNPPRASYQPVTPPRDLHQTELVQDFEPKDSYPLPLDMEIPDMFKDILTPHLPRNEAVAEERVFQDEISEIPLPNKEFTEHILSPHRPRNEAVAEERVFHDEISEIPLPNKELTEHILPPYPKLVEGLSVDFPKPYSSEVLPNPQPAAVKVTRKEVRTEPRPLAGKAKRRKVRVNSSSTSARPKRRKVRVNPSSTSARPRRRKTESRPAEVKISRTGDQSELIPQIAKKNEPNQKTDVVPESEDIQAEGRSEPLSEIEAKDIIPKVAAEQESPEDTKAEVQSEPLPVASKIVRPKVQPESMDKPQYVKKPGLFKRESKES